MDKSKSKTGSCKSCICSVFKDARPGEGYSLIFRKQNTFSPKDTVLTFIKYYPKTCSVSFSVDIQGTQEIAYADCNKLAGVIPRS